MLILLPILVFSVFFLILLGVESRRRDSLVGVRAAFLQTAAFMGGYMLVFSELLSLFKLLAQPAAAICWGLALAAGSWLGWRKNLLADGWRFLQAKWPRPDRFDLLAGAFLAGILGLLLLIALVSPANNNDSLLYHMSRVMHWAQDQSLVHYPTNYEHQLFNPIFAELSILQARLLWGDDRLANLIQWMSLAGSILVITGLTSLLGAGKKGQWVAAVFAASIPMAVLQASSTQNDLVTSFWLIGLLYFVMLACRRKLFPEELVSVGLVFGLGLLTKGTFYPYALLPVVSVLVVLFRRSGFKRALREASVILSIAAALNMGYWIRNIITFGTPLGSTSFISFHVDTRPTPGILAGNLVRAVVQNFSTPSESINDMIVGRLKAGFKGIDPVMDQFDLVWGWNHEDYAGQPLHLLLVPMTGVLLILHRRRFNPGWPVYTLLAAGGFIALAIVTNYNAFTVRLQLPFFISWAPLFGLAVGVIPKRWFLHAVVLFLFLAAMPWVLFNRTRPLIAMRDSSDPFTIPCLASCTTGSILNEPRSNIVFGIWTELRQPYSQAAEAIKASGCRGVGLQIDSHDLEYLFWWLLDAPQSGIRLETISTYPELERYLDPNFRPCAILCSTCGSRTSLHGLDLAGDYNGKIRLYLGDRYDPNPEY